MAAHSPDETIGRIREAGYNPKVDALLDLALDRANAATAEKLALPAPPVEERKVVRPSSSISDFARDFASEKGSEVPEISPIDVFNEVAREMELKGSAEKWDQNQVAGQFRELFNNPDDYVLLLLDLPEEGPEKESVYLKKEDGKLKYIVRNSKGTIVTDYTGISIDTDLTEKFLSAQRDTIMERARQNSHIPLGTEQNLLNNLKKIHAELTIIRDEIHFSEEEKKSFSTALFLLQEYISLQEAFLQTIQPLIRALPSTTQDNEKTRSEMLAIFFQIYHNEKLQEQLKHSDPLMVCLEEIDVLLKRERAACEEIRKKIPCLSGKYAYLPGFYTYQAIQYRYNLAQDIVRNLSAITVNTSQHTDVLAALTPVGASVIKKQIFRELAQVGYIYPLGFSRFKEDLYLKQNYSVGNILLDPSKKILKDAFIQFAEDTQGLSLQMAFFEKVSILLGREPLRCADLKPLIPYCTEDNPLALPMDLSALLQKAFSRTEDSPTTIRAVVVALIPAMQYIHEKLKAALSAFQLSSEILAVLPHLSEIKELLQGRLDLFVLNKVDIAELPPFLRAIFNHPNSALGRSFDKKIKAIAQDKPYLTLLTPALDKFTKTETKILTYSEDEINTLRRDIVSVRQTSPAHLDDFLRVLIEARFARKLAFFMSIQSQRSATKSDKNVAAFTAEDETLQKLLDTKAATAGRILSNFKNLSYYSELMNAIQMETFDSLIEEVLKAWIDPEIRKEIKEIVTPKRIRFIQKTLEKDIYSGIQEKRKFPVESKVLALSKETPLAQPIEKKLSEKTARDRFKATFSDKIIEEEWYFILKEYLDEKLITQECYVWLIAHRKKEALNSIRCTLKHTAWYKSLSNFFNLGTENPDFTLQKTQSIEEILKSPAFNAKIRDGIECIHPEVKKQINEGEKYFFIFTRNSTALTFIQQEFDKQINLLRNGCIFSDSVLNDLAQQKDSILNENFKKILKAKTHSDFMAAYQCLLIKMPCHILDALADSFKKQKKLPSRDIFSAAFLKGINPLPESIAGKKLKESIQSYSRKYASAVDETPEALPKFPYENLQSNLQRNFFTKKKKVSEVLPITPKKAPDQRGAPPPNTPIEIDPTPIAVRLTQPNQKPRRNVPPSPFSTPAKPTITVRGKATPINFQVVYQKITEMITKKDETWSVRTPTAKTTILGPQKDSDQKIEVYDESTLVLSTQIPAPVVEKREKCGSSSLPFKAELEIKMFRHEQADIQLAVDIMGEFSLLDEKHVLEIHIEASEALLPTLLVNYLRSVLNLGKTKPQVWFKAPSVEKEVLIEHKEVCAILKIAGENDLEGLYRALFPPKRNPFPSSSSFFPSVKKRLFFQPKRHTDKSSFKGTMEHPS